MEGKSCSGRAGADDEDGDVFHCGRLVALIDLGLEVMDLEVSLGSCSFFLEVVVLVMLPDGLRIAVVFANLSPEASGR